MRPLTIVVPMAGRGSRFAAEGYELPKPLIPVCGVPMIELVIANITPIRPHQFVFLVLAEHLAVHGVREILESAAPGGIIVPVEAVTRGAAETVLLAGHHLDETPLMIANTDQWVDFDVDDYVRALDSHDGLIMTMRATDPKWSFVRTDPVGKVVEVLEKVPISDQATVGIYNFSSGEAFAAAASAMIEADERVNGEFYVAPVYNRLISAGADVVTYDVGGEGSRMHGLGIPADLDDFLRHPACERAVAQVAGLRRRASAS